MTEYTLEQLEALSGLARRTIRFYMQKGLVDAPFGARKTPQYTTRHLEQLVQIKQFKQAGLNLSRIASLLKPSATTRADQHQLHMGSISQISRIQLCAGVTLDIDQQQCPLSNEALNSLAQLITDHLAQGTAHDERN